MKKLIKESLVRVLIGYAIMMTMLVVKLDLQLNLAQKGDVNLDGKINLQDLSIISNNWSE